MSAIFSLEIGLRSGQRPVLVQVKVKRKIFVSQLIPSYR